MADEGKNEIWDALKKIRIRDSPGNRNSLFLFARIARLAFDEIAALRMDRFTLVTICKALEEEGFLPKGSDPESLGKALCREKKRRGALSGLSGVKKTAAASLSGEKSQNAERRKTNPPPEYPAGGGARPRLRPDNTFDIEMIDLESMTEL